MPFTRQDRIGTARVWIATRPSTEHVRPLKDDGRIIKGVAGWRLQGNDKGTVICYERATGRLNDEGRANGGRPTRRDVQRLLHRDIWPTAVANPGDHYLIVMARGRVRFASIEEVGRSMGVAADRPIMRNLVRKRIVTPCQAVTMLGRGVNVPVARALIAQLMSEGYIGRGVRYGSAYSGIDLIAEALDQETGGDFNYCFASEGDSKVRPVLLATWAARGLREERCYEDALGEGARGEEEVELFSLTASCEQFSRRNHHGSCEARSLAISDISQCMEYVRRKMPRVVLTENVAEPSVMHAITSMLTRLGRRPVARS